MIGSPTACRNRKKPEHQRRPALHERTGRHEGPEQVFRAARFHARADPETEAALRKAPLRPAFAAAPDICFRKVILRHRRFDTAGQPSEYVCPGCFSMAEQPTELRRFGKAGKASDTAETMTQQDSVSEQSTDDGGVMTQQDSVSEQSPDGGVPAKNRPSFLFGASDGARKNEKSKKIRFLHEKCNFVLDMMQKRCYNSTHKSKQPYEVFRKTAARLTEGVILSGVRKDRD